jgi:hypothetical protein
VRLLAYHLKLYENAWRNIYQYCWEINIITEHWTNQLQAMGWVFLEKLLVTCQELCMHSGHLLPGSQNPATGSYGESEESSPQSHIHIKIHINIILPSIPWSVLSSDFFPSVFLARILYSCPGLQITVLKKGTVRTCIQWYHKRCASLCLLVCVLYINQSLLV